MFVTARVGWPGWLVGRAVAESGGIRVVRGVAMEARVGAGVELGSADTGRVGMGGRVGNPEQPDATTRSKTQIVVRRLRNIFLPSAKTVGIVSSMIIQIIIRKRSPFGSVRFINIGC